MKYKHLERQEYELTCISPIHIGSGETLNPIEYVYDARHQVIYFLDESKWKNFLVNKKLLSSFMDYISSNCRPILGLWMKSEGLSFTDLQHICTHRCRVVTKDIFSSNRSRKQSANEVHRLITDAMGIPYIPGSSIKGCLRSGLLYAWIKAHPESHEKYWNDVLRCNFKKKNDWKNHSYLESDVFSKLQFKEKANLMVKSCLRGLAVSDTMADESLRETILLQKLDASTKRDRQGKMEHTISTFRECIPAGTKLRFTITLDMVMMAELGIHSAQDVIDASREFTAYNLAMQKRVFGREYAAEFKEAELADMLLGGGVGFQAKTVVYPLAPEFNEGKRVLANKLEDAFHMHHHRECDTKIAPRTLKLTRISSDRWIMGLCSLREV